MHTKCPNCGAVHSLDSLISNNDASNVIAAAFELSGDLGKLLMRYCGLFRPGKNQLTFARLATLMNELLPDIKAQRIMRNGDVHEAPIDAWVYAMTVVMAKRDNQELKLPLKGHGLLYEIISNYKPDNSLSIMPQSPQKTPQQTAIPTGKQAQRTAFLQSKINERLNNG